MFNIFNKKSKGKISEDFFKNTKDRDNELKDCDLCDMKNGCGIINNNKTYLCSFVTTIDNYNPDKDSILIIDDNPGIVSFIEDDLAYFDLEKYNIIKFMSKYAGFNLIGTIQSHKGLNIKYAILDLTLGGGVYNERDGNLVIDGIDVLVECLKYDKDMKYFFFTGNTLNPYIRKNKEMIDKFKKETNKDIHDFILYKTKLSPSDRRKYIKGFLEL